jgi:hypothetical protein
VHEDSFAWSYDADEVDGDVLDVLALTAATRDVASDGDDLER